MYENDDYYAQARQQRQIEDSCYRLGVPVDIYYRYRSGEFQIQEVHELSRLEKRINEFEWDGD